MPLDTGLRRYDHGWVVVSDTKILKTGIIHFF